MNITFIPLAEFHFPLLLKWLETPHVKAWWDRDISWTPALISEKYTNYVKGYVLEAGITKAISAYIICVNTAPVGYIQIYNAHVFSRTTPLTGLPKKLGAFDMLIGEEAYLNRGIGSQALAQFLREQGNLYTHIFADPECTNYAAIRAYEKAGFIRLSAQLGAEEVWMIREQVKAF